VLKWLEGKGKFQVQLENGFLVAVAPENVIRHIASLTDISTDISTDIKIGQSRELYCKLVTK
jgi:hypothetical protein